MTAQLSIEDLAPAFRPPAPALSGPGWTIPDHGARSHAPEYHARAIRAAVRLLEEAMGDRVAWHHYREAAR